VFTLDMLRLADSDGEMIVAGGITGTGKAAYYEGTIDLANVRLHNSKLSMKSGPRKTTAVGEGLKLESAAVSFSPVDPANPFVSARVTGEYDDEAFVAILIGPLDHLIRTYEGAPPLTDAAVRDIFAGRAPAAPEGFRLEIYPPVAVEAGLYPFSVEPIEPESPKL
jgi:hypothetical protein